MSCPDATRMHQMPSHLLLCTGCILSFDSIQDPEVFGCCWRKVARLCEMRETIEPSLIAQAPHQLNEPLVLQRAKKAKVKLTIDIQEIGEISLLCGVCNLSGKSMRLGQIRPAELAGDSAHARDLQHKAQLEELIEVMIGQDDNSETAIADDFHQPFMDEVEQGFPDRCCRYTEFRCEVGCRVNFSSLKLARNHADTNGPASLVSKIRGL
jgi:hypothetical protein